jgi:uncharacterized membrane protein
MTAKSFGKFRVGGCVSEAFEATKSNFGLLLGVGILSMACFVVAGITIIGYFIFVPVIAWGCIKFLLNVIDGEAKFSDMFSGFSHFGTVLGRMLWLGIILVLISLVGASVQIIGDVAEFPELWLAGAVINLIFSIFVTVRLNFAIFFAVDQDATATESLRMSWNSTSGLVLSTFILALVSTLINFLGALCFLVGLFFTIPMSYLMWVSAYRQMVGTSDDGADTVLVEDAGGQSA